jgi:hypothetical protein
VTAQRSFAGQPPGRVATIYRRTKMAHRQLLTDEERQALLGIPLDADSMARFFTLSRADRHTEGAADAEVLHGSDLDTCGVDAGQCADSASGVDRTNVAYRPCKPSCSMPRRAATRRPGGNRHCVCLRCRSNADLKRTCMIARASSSAWRCRHSSPRAGRCSDMVHLCPAEATRVSLD